MTSKTELISRFMESSSKILQQDKALLFFPIISCGCLIILFFAPLMIFGASGVVGDGYSANVEYLSTVSTPLKEYAYYFIFCLMGYIVTNFFSTAFLACILSCMEGEHLTFSMGIEEASKRLLQIFGWSLIVTLVDVLLHAIERQSQSVGTLMMGTLGIMFSIASLFIVPMLVVENRGPTQILKESIAPLRKTWRNSTIGFFLLFMLIGGVGCCVLVATAFITESMVVSMVAVFYTVLFLLIMATAK